MRNRVRTRQCLVASSSFSTRHSALAHSATTGGVNSAAAGCLSVSLFAGEIRVHLDHSFDVGVTRVFER